MKVDISCDECSSKEVAVGYDNEGIFIICKDCLKTRDEIVKW